MTVTIIPVPGIPEVQPGADLADLIAAACADADLALGDSDVVVVTQKVVSKAEGRLCQLQNVVPGTQALTLADRLDTDARVIQVILDNSVRIVRDERALIVETAGGVVCANAGVDRSNLCEPETVSLLPEDSDASAVRLADRLSRLTGAAVGVIISDTFGRPWRRGLANVALGVAGTTALADHRGQADHWGRALTSTQIAVADEIAGAAELVMHKAARIPAAIVRGLGPRHQTDGRAHELLRPAEEDLFR